MATCQWEGKTKSDRFCGLLAQENSRFCPRHTFLHNIAEQQRMEKELAAAEKKEFEGVSAMPKTRADLVAKGYRYQDSSECSGCHAHIEWWLTPNLKRAPFDVMVIESSAAVSHFATCPERQRFRRAS